MRRVYMSEKDEIEALSRYYDLCIIGGDFNTNKNNIAIKYDIPSILEFEEPNDELVNAACIVSLEVVEGKLDSRIDESIVTLARYYSYLTGEDEHIEQIKIAKMICHCARLYGTVWNYKELGLNTYTKANGILKSEIYNYDLYVATDYGFSSNNPELKGIDGLALSTCRSIYVDGTLPFNSEGYFSPLSFKVEHDYIDDTKDNLFYILSKEEGYLCADVFNEDDYTSEGYKVKFDTLEDEGAFVVTFESEEEARGIAKDLCGDNEYKVLRYSNNKYSFTKILTVVGDAYIRVGRIKDMILNYHEYLDANYDYVEIVDRLNINKEDLWDKIFRLAKEE